MARHVARGSGTGMAEDGDVAHPAPACWLSQSEATERNLPKGGMFNSNKTLMYEFNDCGVCTNPDTIEIAKRSRIKLCEFNGKWFSGYDLEYISGGIGRPCSKDWEHYATRKEARDAAFNGAIKHIEGEIEWYKKAIDIRDDNGYGSSLKQCYVLLNILKEKQVQHPQPVQLSLFDF